MMQPLKTFLPAGLGLVIGLSGCVDYKSPMVVRHKAMLAEQRGDYESALEVREQFLKDSPDYYFISEVYYEQAMTYLDQGNLEKALEYFNKAIEDDPEFLQALIRRCEVNSRLGHHDQAVTDGNRAMALSVSDTNLSRAFLYQGNSQAAMQHLNRAMIKWQMSLLLDPTQMSALTQLFQAYLNTEQLDEALELIEDSLAQNDRFAQKQYLYSQILARLNRQEEAEAALKRAHELNLGKEIELPESIEEFSKQDVAVIEVAPLRHEVAKPLPLPEPAPPIVPAQEIAINVARNYLTTQGVEVVQADPTHDNLLICQADGTSFEVLVKQSPAALGHRFQLSQDELALITSQSPHRGMVVVTDITTDSLTGQTNPQSGRVTAFARSWKPDPQRLSPVLFEYEIPSTPVEE